MDFKPREVQINVGAITANQAAGFHLGTYPNTYPMSAFVDWVLVDNRSNATLVLISDPSRPDILPGERKKIDLLDQPREVYLEASATVSSGDVRITVKVTE